MNQLFNHTLLAQNDIYSQLPSWYESQEFGQLMWIIGGCIFAEILLLIYVYTTQTGVIARGTTKEAVRQPLFLLLLLLSLAIFLLYSVLPFFSFGEDVKMVKDCGLATLLIAGLILAIWTSSTSIADEIEGKTAMTLLSKPVTRRQFVVGKYLGILHAVLALLIPLGIALLLLIYFRIEFDARETRKDLPMHLILRDVMQVWPGIVLIFFEIAILSAISVTVSTRLPMIPNMVTCFTIFVVGHLTSILVKAGVLKVEFVAATAKFISTVLPALESFNMQAAVATGEFIPPDYLFKAGLYCGVYSTAVILLAFILFEDRDLA